MRLSKSASRTKDSRSPGRSARSFRSTFSASRADVPRSADLPTHGAAHDQTRAWQPSPTGAGERSRSDDASKHGTSKPSSTCGRDTTRRDDHFRSTDTRVDPLGISASRTAEVPRPAPSEYPRPGPRRRRDPTPRNIHVPGRGGAATRPLGISASRAAASPRPNPSEYPRSVSTRPVDHGLGQVSFSGSGVRLVERRPERRHGAQVGRRRPLRELGVSNKLRWRAREERICEG